MTRHRHVWVRAESAKAQVSFRQGPSSAAYGNQDKCAWSGVLTPEACSCWDKTILALALTIFSELSEDLAGTKNHGLRWWLACIVIDCGVKPTEIYTQSPPCEGHSPAALQALLSHLWTPVNTHGVSHELSLAEHLVVSFLVLWDKLLSCSPGWLRGQSPFTECPEKGKSSRMAWLAPLSHHGVPRAVFPLLLSHRAFCPSPSSLFPPKTVSLHLLLSRKYTNRDSPEVDQRPTRTRSSLIFKKRQHERMWQGLIPKARLWRDSGLVNIYSVNLFISLLTVQGKANKAPCLMSCSSFSGDYVTQPNTPMTTGFASFSLQRYWR